MPKKLKAKIKNICMKFDNDGKPKFHSFQDFLNSGSPLVEDAEEELEVSSAYAWIVSEKLPVKLPVKTDAIYARFKLPDFRGETEEDLITYVPLSDLHTSGTPMDSDTDEEYELDANDVFIVDPKNKGKFLKVTSKMIDGWRQKANHKNFKEMEIISESETPWDAARKFKLWRISPLSGKAELMEPGVNFFILALESLGLTTFFSCEGHPTGFYVSFNGNTETADRIQKCGWFRVERHNEKWVIRIPDPEIIERDPKLDPKVLKRALTARRNRRLRDAAKSWQKTLLS
jgi:hypothetical protein